MGTKQLPDGSYADEVIAINADGSAIAGGSGGTGETSSTPFRRISTADNNLAFVKANAGKIYTLVATNNHASNIAYLKLYNKASAPVVASDTPVQVYSLAPGGNGVALSIPGGMTFSTGIAIAITGGMADTDATNIAAAQVALSLSYV